MRPNGKWYIVTVLVKEMESQVQLQESVFGGDPMTLGELDGPGRRPALLT
jgi:hypothetical protein